MANRVLNILALTTRTLSRLLTLCLTMILVSGFSSDFVSGLEPLDNPAIHGSRLPRLRALPGGEVLMSWVEPLGENHVLRFSVFHDGHWQRQGNVAMGSQWFVNWSDFPSVAAIDDRFWVAHWLVKQPGGATYDYDVVTSVSNDAGVTWSTPVSPYQDRTAAEHGFATIFPVDHEAGIVWLDGRYHIKTKEQKKTGNFNLRYARIHRNGIADTDQVIDDNTCTCCWPSIAVTSDGPVAVWRGRTDLEIRDHRVSLLRNGVWSAPAPLGAEGWQINGCPVNGPAIAAQGRQVVTAWFTAEGDRPRIRAAFSADGGQHFSQPIDIDDAAPLGRIGLVWRDQETAVVSWMTSANTASNTASLALRALHPNGGVGATLHVTDISAGRDTGVPQMVSTDSGLMLAWTGSAPAYGIRTALVSWNMLQPVLF